jgi:hypothetical protein
MPWNVVHLEREGVVETVYSGAITTADLRDAIMATVAMAKERGSRRFLSDCSQLEEGGSLTDIYELPGLYERLGIGRNWKEGIVLPVIPQAEDQLKFYETVTQNQGFQVRIFPSREEALSWLTAGDAEAAMPG